MIESKMIQNILNMYFVLTILNLVVNGQEAEIQKSGSVKCDNIPPKKNSTYNCEWYASSALCEGLEEAYCRESCGKCATCNDIPVPGLSCDFIVQKNQCNNTDIVSKGQCQKSCGRCSSELNVVENTTISEQFSSAPQLEKINIAAIEEVDNDNFTTDIVSTFMLVESTLGFIPTPEEEVEDLSKDSEDEILTLQIEPSSNLTNLPSPSPEQENTDQNQNFRENEDAKFDPPEIDDQFQNITDEKSGISFENDTTTYENNTTHENNTATNDDSQINIADEKPGISFENQTTTQTTQPPLNVSYAPMMEEQVSSGLVEDEEESLQVKSQDDFEKGGEISDYDTLFGDLNVNRSAHNHQFAHNLEPSSTLDDQVSIQLQKGGNNDDDSMTGYIVISMIVVIAIAAYFIVKRRNQSQRQGYRVMKR